VRLVLASASPRRAELLRAAGIPFSVRAADVDESCRPAESPDAYVTRLARAKAEAVGLAPDAVVLGADTTVVVDGECLGKPRDDEEARAMLRRLSGRAHDVLTGIALVHPGGAIVDRASTRVIFQRLDEDELAWYVGTGEPRDKAGAYGIQGAASRFIVGIEGSYSNVVGLPVELVYQHLRGLRFTGGSLSADSR
jgi:septum formation protein